MLVGPVYFEKFSADRPGRFYMMRKCYRYYKVYAKVLQDTGTIKPTYVGLEGRN